MTKARRELDGRRHESDPMWTKFASHSKITDADADADADAERRARGADVRQEGRYGAPWAT